MLLMEQFLASVEKRAYRMAEFATGHSDEALDIVQDAMFKLVEKYSGRDAREWGPLFHTILQSRINDWHRRNAVRNKFGSFFARADDEDPIQSAPDPVAFDPARKLKGEQAVEHLEMSIKVLPLRQQQAFLLRYWQEYDVAQTARIMGCSQGSVKTHCSRAMTTLREQLGDHI